MVAIFPYGLLRVSLTRGLHPVHTCLFLHIMIAFIYAFICEDEMMMKIYLFIYVFYLFNIQPENI